MATRLRELLRCELPIQLAPMGSVSATPALPLAAVAAGGHGMYSALLLPPAVPAPMLAARTSAFGVNFVGGRVRGGDRQGVGVGRAQARRRARAAAATGAVRAIRPAAEIVAELARGLR